MEPGRSSVAAVAASISAVGSLAAASVDSLIESGDTSADTSPDISVDDSADTSSELSTATSAAVSATGSVIAGAGDAGLTCCMAASWSSIDWLVVLSSGAWNVSNGEKGSMGGVFPEGAPDDESWGTGE